MGKSGQNNYKGINAQSWAAMSLFLQHLRNPDFFGIELESPNMNDFNLIFRDGHKVICEAKARARNFNYSDLKDLVRSVLKHLKDNDEILVICSRLSKSLENKVSHMKYFSKQMAPYFKSKGFKPEEIQALSKVRFWNVSGEAHYNVVYSLFGELLNFWLPQEELERKVDSILLKKIYGGSAKGKSISKSDILQEIDDYRKNTVKFSGYFDSERVNVEKQLAALIRAIEDNKSPEWAEAPLSAISAQPNLMFYVIDKFKNKKIKSLKDWANLWNLNKIYGFSFSLYKIFENNLNTHKNRKYVLDFIEKRIPEIQNYYRHNFFEIDVVRIINKILEKDKHPLNQAFNVVKKILASFKNDYFYLKDGKADRDYEKQEMCKLLKRIYLDGTKKIKNEIYDLIISDFNLVEDQGEHSHYSPMEIFEILKDYLISDSAHFEAKFMNFVNELSKQFNKFYKKFGKKVTFDGWELMGGSVSFWGGNYKAEDRHFISYILEPAVTRYYKNEGKKGWKFIRENCLIKDKDVDSEHPDFLNRAALTVILERFTRGNDVVVNEAFEILKDFVLRRKGIPHKSELIYQALRGDFSDEGKWKLVKVSIEHYATPVNPFVEQIVSELAAKGHKEAKEVFNSWSKNSDYYKKTEFLGGSLTQHIDRLLDSSFDDAVNTFKNYISSEYFIKELDNFDAYKVADLLGKILRIKFEVGLEIINRIRQQYPQLSKNQQILLSFGVLDSIDKKSEDRDFVKKVYYSFMDPFLEGFDNDIDKILQIFTHGNAREAFVQFAEKLASNKLINEALRIIEVFINDPDPFPPGKDPEDLEGKYSHHKKIEDEGQETSAINSVRGWSAWILAHCAVLDGRPYLPKIIKLTKRLSEDSDYYVQQMACFPLSRLVNDRLCHMPENKDILFFNDDQKKALGMAKDVENMALNLLDRILKSSPNVRKALAKNIMSVVGRIRTLNQGDALTLIEKLRNFPDEETSEIAGMILYYAEFRKDSFKDWKWSFTGLYDDLQPFDDADLKIKLKEIMLENSKTKAAFAWEFYSLTDCALRKVKHSLDYEEAFTLSVKYIKDLISEYDHRTFETVYRFIDENIKQPKNFDKCYEIWRRCLDIEKDALEKLVKDKAYDIYWWPYHYNGNILLMVNKEKGQQQFLDDFEFLSKYPKEVDIGGIKEAVDLLKEISIPNDQVERIFNKLIERHSSFYDDKQQWMKRESFK